MNIEGLPQQNTTTPTETRPSLEEREGKLDFIERMKTFLQTLTELEKKQFEKVGLVCFEPKLVQTKGGKNLRLNAYEWEDSSLSTTKSMVIEKQFALLASDPMTETYIGLRHMELGYARESDDHLRASGDINVYPRGQGIASTMDRNLEIFLGELAKENDKDIVWEVSNGNAKDIANLQRQKEYSKDSKEKQHIDDLIILKQQEQVRWQDLYASGGKLGFVSAQNEGMDSEKKILRNTETNLSSHKADISELKELIANVRKATIL